MNEIELMRETARASALISVSATVEEASAYALTSAKAAGYHSLSIVASECGTPRVVFTNAPKTSVLEYQQRGYLAHDPLVERGLQSDTPKSAQEIGDSRMTPAQREVLRFIQKSTDCDAALVIPVRSSVAASGVIVFGGKSANQGAVARAALTVLGHCVFGRIQELEKRAPARPAAAAATLSPREKEVLGWIAKGKCDSEIAIICNMSERTARFHVANAKAKLDTPSRVQAVTKALDLGLIAA